MNKITPESATKVREYFFNEIVPKYLLNISPNQLFIGEFGIEEMKHYYGDGESMGCDMFKMIIQFNNTGVKLMMNPEYLPDGYAYYKFFDNDLENPYFHYDKTLKYYKKYSDGIVSIYEAIPEEEYQNMFNMLETE